MKVKGEGLKRIYFEFLTSKSIRSVSVEDWSIDSQDLDSTFPAFFFLEFIEFIEFFIPMSSPPPPTQLHLQIHESKSLTSWMRAGSNVHRRPPTPPLMNRPITGLRHLHSPSASSQLPVIEVRGEILEEAHSSQIPQHGHEEKRHVLHRNGRWVTDIYSFTRSTEVTSSDARRMQNRNACYTIIFLFISFLIIYFVLDQWSFFDSFGK